MANALSVKEHIHAVFADGSVSISLCGHTPDYYIRRHHIKDVKNYTLKSTCRNCFILYEQLRRVRFDEEHQVMRRLLNRQIIKH